MTDAYYDNILMNIQRHVPEFQTLFDKEDAYPVTFDFGQFLIENITNDELLGRAALFIDEALSVGTTMTEDLIVMQIFQLIYEDGNLIKVFRKHLPFNANIIFDTSFKEYNKI